MVSKGTERKLCGKCGEQKQVEAFYPNRQSKDGRHPYCKECARAIQREWRARKHKRLAHVRATPARAWSAEEKEARRVIDGCKLKLLRRKRQEMIAYLIEHEGFSPAGAAGAVKTFIETMQHVYRQSGSLPD